MRLKCKILFKKRKKEVQMHSFLSSSLIQAVGLITQRSTFKLITGKTKGGEVSYNFDNCPGRPVICTKKRNEMRKKEERKSTLGENQTACFI